VVLSRQPHFALTQVWYLSVATVTLQALISLTLLAREFRRKLGAPPATAAVAAAVAPGSERH
jgi:hypothetical protein